MIKKSGLIMLVGMGLTLLFAGGVSAAPRTLTDQAGRTVAVPHSPCRVISLAPNITEIIYDLGCEDRLQGVTTYSDYPAAAKALPIVGSYVRLDLEKIVSLKPDLCIAIKDGNPKETVMRLESLGIPVYAVNPRSLDTIMSSVLAIGELLNASERAGQLVETMRARIDRVEQRVAAASSRPRVFFQIGVSPIVSAGSDTFIHELIEKAGGVNLAGTRTSYPRYSFEEIVVLAPDIIIMTTMERDNSFDEVKARWRQWPSVPAVATDRIFIVDSDVFDRPTPRLIDALETLARMIHPELPWDNLQKGPH
ncbi:MAG: cobalamin-binding protein [Desulfosalsimonadaceae bacterium]|nr:cobalamin-binding protein [Desulfosalsimonadaceae bacterium]